MLRILHLLPILGFARETYVNNSCSIPGATSVTFGGPITLTGTTSYVTNAGTMLSAYKLFQQWINYERVPPGIKIGSDYACLNLNFHDDTYNTAEVEIIAENLTSNNLVDVYISPYSSDLVFASLDATEETKTLSIASASASTYVFEDRLMGFAVLPPSKKILTSILRKLYEIGAQSIAFLSEDTLYMGEACNATYTIIEEYGLEMEVMAKQYIPINAHASQLDAANEKLFSLSNNGTPDVLISCNYYTLCSDVIASFERLNFAPKALVMATCQSVTNVINTLGDSSMYAMVGVYWSKDFDFVDPITGWDTQTFHDKFYNFAGVNPITISVSSFALMELLVHAIETTGSTDSKRLAVELARTSLNTALRAVSFDENFMNNAEAPFIQINESLISTVVSPYVFSTAEIIYPMKSWYERTCNNEFGTTDSCQCTTLCDSCEFDDLKFEYEGCQLTSEYAHVSFSFKDIHSCNTNEFISTYGELPQSKQTLCGFIVLPSAAGIVFFIFIILGVLLAVFSLIWVYRTRKSKFILANQPLLLGSFAMGSVFFCSQAFTFVGRPTAFGCAIRVILHSIGFTMMFGSLLLVVYRVWRVFGNDKLVKVKIKERALLKGLATMIAVDFAILAFWMIARTPSATKVDYNSVSSYDVNLETSCILDAGMEVTTWSYKVILMSIGCYLSFETRNVDKKFIQSNLMMYAVFVISVMWILVTLTKQFLGLKETTNSILAIICIITSTVIAVCLVLGPKYSMFKSAMAPVGEANIRLSHITSFQVSSQAVPSLFDDGLSMRAIRSKIRKTMSNPLADTGVSPLDVLELLDVTVKLDGEYRALKQELAWKKKGVASEHKT